MQIGSIFSLFPINFVSHDVVEVINCDKSIIIQIGLGEDVLNFFFGQVFSQILGNLFQLQCGDTALK